MNSDKLCRKQRGECWKLLPPGLCDQIMVLTQLASLGSGEWESPGWLPGSTAHHVLMGSQTSLWWLEGQPQGKQSQCGNRDAPHGASPPFALTLWTWEGNGETLVRGWRLRHGIHIHGKVRRPLPLKSNCLLLRGCLLRPGPASWLLMRGLPSHLGLSS